MILETTFLIDLERELRRGVEGPAHRFLESHAKTPLFITFTIAGELAAGLPPGERNLWMELIRPFRMLDCTPEVCWEYGQAYRYLKANDLLIGANDLWIGATALAHGQPVVTRNVREFGRIPGLRVEAYAEG